jgi:multidrug efflux system outer membrane protein
MGAAGRRRRLARPNRAAVALVALALVAGCSVGPNYRRPAAVATMPAAYAGAAGEWKVATPRAHVPKGRWWEVFGDPALNRLEAEAAAANQELKAAAARFAQARAVIDVARSGYFPRIGGAVAAGRQSDSENRPLPTSGQAAGPEMSHSYNNFAVPFDVGYEVDLWGRVRRQVESARASAAANAADLEGVKLVIAAEVAADYFALRALEGEKAALDASLAAYRTSVALTRQRRAGGLASDLDVVQAETVLQAALAQSPPLARLRLQLVHALAVLTGRPAPLFALDAQPLDRAPPAIEPGLPSTLLERRPDVAAAERRMAAANASVGVAKAAYYPSIRLTGLAGLQSVDLGSLFSWPSTLWAVGLSISLPLFDGGQRRGNLNAAKAAYEETVARYRHTVLRAFAEVEDNLAAQRLLAEEYELQVVAWESARRQVELAQSRYRGGLSSYLPVMVAQNAALERERSVARLRGQRFAASVALVKSLGGGWRE